MSDWWSFSPQMNIMFRKYTSNSLSLYKSGSKERPSFTTRTLGHLTFEFDLQRIVNYCKWSMNMGRSNFIYACCIVKNLNLSGVHAFVNRVRNLSLCAFDVCSFRPITRLVKRLYGIGCQSIFLSLTRD